MPMTILTARLRARAPMWARRVVKRARRTVRPARWGNLRRLRPFSESYGFDRGTPIDRVHIERFLASHAADVRGDVLEIKDAAYTHRFGGDRVHRIDVLDIDSSNGAATIIGDLCDPLTLPVERFDCILLAQTLQLVATPDIALANAWRALRPGGVLFVTVPAVSRRENIDGVGDFWRFTPVGLERLLSTIATDAGHTVLAKGNLPATVGFLLGLAAEELRPQELRVDDPDFPLVVMARSVKTAAS